MANKNTKGLRNQIRKASKKGIQEISYLRPVKDYHSSMAKPPFYTVNYPCAVAKSDGVNSKNERRNMSQKIYKNTGGSQTFHESLNKSIPVIHKNHSYIDSYRQSNEIKS